MKPIHIYAAESVFEPFWDPEISRLDEWAVVKIDSSKIKISPIGFNAFR